MPKIRQSVETKVLDEKTGKFVTKRANKTLSWGEEPSYIKLYLEDIMYLSDMPKQYAGLTMALLKRMSYAGDEDGMCVTLIPRIKKAICGELGWDNVKSLNNALSKLVEGNILHRIDRGLYQFNPYLFGKGDWQDVGRLRLDITYDVKGRTFQTYASYNSNETSSAAAAADDDENYSESAVPEDGDVPDEEDEHGEECTDSGNVAI